MTQHAAGLAAVTPQVRNELLAVTREVALGNLSMEAAVPKLREIIEEPASQDTAVRAIAQASRILGLDKSEVRVSGSLPELLASLPPPRP